MALKRARKRPGAARGAAHALGFFRDMLVHTKGEWAGQPFTLLPWQRAVVQALFGTRGPDGLRQYRRAYIEIPRKNGKTTWMAGLGLYLLLADGEPGAEIYSAAADREQAAISFELARSMVEANPDLKGEVAVYRRELVVRSTESRYRVLSADAPTKHGLNAHGILFDELHAQPNRELFDVLWTSTGARRQPLSIAITTAGYDRTSVCWEQHDLAVKVRDGVVRDPTMLPVLYAAPPTSDWTDPAIWAAANPSLGKTIKREYLAAECRRAQATPAYENTFRRLHLCQWTEQFSRWLPIEAWTACGAAVTDAELVGAPAYGGLDLGAQDDFSAFVIVFPLADGRVALRTRYWLPEQTVTERPHRPYGLWARQGHLTVTSGTTTDLDVVEAAVREDCARYAVRELAYDARNALQLAQHLQNAGVVMVDQPQGFKLNEALRKLLALTQARQFAHGGDPILAWMAGNMTVKTGLQGEVRPAKEMAADKIDGLVALAMALDRWIRQPAVEESPSAYADHGLLTV